uniref:Histidine protein methyltransferase 1 homolog n=1 Tax=Tanacetum cinerariifolium TaxID=118510 RepID=A0A6L2KJH7_TANCI|nr:histidine protein methyltransferase 1 homolog [Tanacetum cinerariifolium]
MLRHKFFLERFEIFKERLIMRAPSLLAQCLPGLAPDRVGLSISTASDRETHLSSPAVEIVPSKMEHPYRYAGESIDLQGVNITKGRVSVSDMIGSELMPSKADGSYKSCDSSFDLVNVLKQEIRDAQLSFRGKRVLECLKPPYGVLFVSTKKHFVGFNSAAKQLRSVVDGEGIIDTHIIKEATDKEIWKFFLK